MDLNTDPADPHTKPSLIASNGAYVAFSGKRTGYFSVESVDPPSQSQWSETNSQRRTSLGVMLTGP